MILVVVGNIGSTSRVNYTVVGDTANAASRLESLAKEIGTEVGFISEECVVLYSEATGHDLGDGFEARDLLGAHTLRGRATPVKVFQLVSAPYPPRVSRHAELPAPAGGSPQ